jgi:hypothetical protein
MIKLLSAAALTAATLSLGACATVTRGSDVAWEVKSTPPGADVKTSNGMSCSPTPCSIKMPRKDKFTATLTKPGYKPAQVIVTNRIAGNGGVALAGNVLIGGIIGVGIDAVTGAALDLTPNPAVITLEPIDAAPVAAPAVSSAPMAAPAAPMTPPAKPN